MAARFSWRLLAGDARTLLPFARRRGNFTLQSDGHECLSLLGVHVLFFPIIVSVPHRLTVDAGLLKRLDWYTCARIWLVDGLRAVQRVDVQPPGAVTPAAARVRLLLNMGLDIDVLRPVPQSPLMLMRERGCVWLHSQRISNAAWHDEDCVVEADQAALE